jgi:hypothetical protein
MRGDLRFIEGGYDGLRITHCQGSGVGVSSIQNKLDVRCSSTLQVGAELRSDIHGDQRRLVVDSLLQLLLIMNDAQQVKGWRACKARDELTR